ncbi:hypothetical protein OEZ85_003440 [Tetradesmus obliquus]|uniref:DUF4378 domain-containing protein n=1 Tax=Tetradesmus obliquus TaxID=3088 RepID=A0ABY8UBS1_TETOB|nr:hypothetical protein OEZ85_003440 [Tetradesmus obliquus]
MDLASLVSNKPLLASLSREYELLKSTQADINYEEWIVQRLKLAAAQQQRSLSTGTAAVHAALPGAVAPGAEQQRGDSAVTHANGNGHYTVLQDRSGLYPSGVPDLTSSTSWQGSMQQAAEQQQLQQPAQQEWQAVPQQAAPEAAVLAHHHVVAATAATASTSANGPGPQQLPEAVQNSWLVKSVLQPSRTNAAGNSAASGLHAAPEFIRIAGEAGKRNKPQQQQQQQQQQEALPSSDRRSQLKKRSGVAEAWDEAAAVAAARQERQTTAGAGSSSPPIRSALLAAARQKLPIRARAAAAVVPGGWTGMSVQEVQGVQLAVQQQLQEQQRHEEEGRLTRLEETASHILGVLGRLEEQLQQPAAAAAHANSSALLGRAAAAAAAAGSDLLQEPAVVSNVLSALDRIEAQEQEIRRRWFGSSSEELAAPEPAAQDAGAAEDAAAVTLGGIATTPAGAASAADLDGRAAPQAPTALVVPAQPRAAGSSHHQQQQQQQQQQQPELLSPEALKSIRAGRRRFLKHQAMVDGSLEVLDSPPRQNTALFSSPEPGDEAGRSSSRAARRRAKQQLQPTHVVEAVADLLLDELLFGQVDELDGFCEALCSQLFEEEFVEA